MNTKSKFLIIDDSEIDRIIASRLLKVRLGILDIAFASNGLEGIAYIRKHRNEMPNGLVILLDIRMPEMGGFEFIDAFDAMDPNLLSATSVIMLSSTLDTEDVDRARKHPRIKALLGKPLQTEILSTVA